jgi:hypothetical protein
VRTPVRPFRERQFALFANAGSPFLDLEDERWFALYWHQRANQRSLFQHREISSRMSNAFRTTFQHSQSDDLDPRVDGLIFECHASSSIGAQPMFPD